MGIPYTFIAIAALILITFFKVGDLDDEIGNPVGLAAGVLVVGLALVFPGGYLRIVLYAVGGFLLLTVYKIARSMLEATNRARDRGAEQSDAPDGEDAADDP